MFKWLLISKYLRRKLAPLFAALAVTVCTMMVIVVMSVMGGFLDLLQNSAHKLTGDVVIDANTYGGFPYYQDLIERIEKLPSVEAATPTVVSYGLLRLFDSTKPVEVMGIRPREMDRIVDFSGTLMWQSSDIANLPENIDLNKLSLDLRSPLPSDDRPGCVIGIETNPVQWRDEKGQYNPNWAAVFSEAVISVLPVTTKGDFVDAQRLRCVVLNEFKSGLYEIDSSRVYVPFDELQRKLLMNGSAQSVDAEGNLVDKPVPARASEIMVKAADGYTPQQAEAITGIMDDFLNDHPDLAVQPRVRTWFQRHHTLLSAVENEKGLVTFLFVIISVVAVVMVATTFYTIVLEKTRDIGVLRAIGASSYGVSKLFLGYGLGVGTLGSLIGLILASIIVTHLNNIQDTLATRMFSFITFVLIIVISSIIVTVATALLCRRRDNRLELTMLAAAATLVLLSVAGYCLFPHVTLPGIATLDGQFGWRMWDPRVYFFERIPDRVDLFGSMFVVLGAIVSSVVGALIPAILAAIMNPVEALRYE